MAACTCQKHLAPRATTTESPLVEEEVDNNKEERATSRRIRIEGGRGGSRPGRSSRGLHDSSQGGRGVSGGAVSVA